MHVPMSISNYVDLEIWNNVDWQFRGVFYKNIGRIEFWKLIRIVKFWSFYMW